MTAQTALKKAEQVDNPFAAPTTTESSTVGGAMMTSQAAASIQGMVVMAKKFPRDPAAAMQRILDACTRTKLAEAAEYAYPRGGETVVGPSIRLAETVAQNWGNIDFGIVELSQEGGRSHVMAYAWDLETNVRQQKVFVVEHIRKAKGSLKVLTDPRDVYELTANQGARRVRACILGVIPGDVIETAVAQCRLTLKNSMAAPEEEIRKMIEAFATFDVPEAAVRKRLGKSFKAVTAAEVIRMRQIFASLRDGMSSPADWFDLEASGDDEPPAPTNGSTRPQATETTDALKERLRAGDEKPIANPPKGPNGAPVDSNGEVFDPALHALDENDEPVLNKDGSFRKRPGKKSDEPNTFTDNLNPPAGGELL